MSEATLNELEQIEQESESIGRVYTEEYGANPDIIREKVDMKIKAILDKYGYRYTITSFFWENGQMGGMIDMVKKSEGEAAQP